jgi:hypothetical protein
MSQTAQTESQRAYPFLAPLSSTMIQYSFQQRYQAHYTQPTIPVLSAAQAAQLAQEQFQRIWTDYLTDFRSARHQIAEDMDGVVVLDKMRPIRKKELNPAWFRTQLSQIGPQEKGRLISADAIDAFIKGGVLRKSSWGVYEPESMAAVLLCRQLNQKRERSWLPSAIPRDEEWYWIWTQAAPDAPLRPSPYPNLPADLSPASLVFTRWAGASWSNVAWQRIGNLGAISFAGLLQAAHEDPSIATFEELLITLRPPQLEPWNRTQKVVDSIEAASPTTRNNSEPQIAMNVGLADSLEILAHYQRTGTLQATIKRRQRHERITIELLQGRVVACHTTPISTSPTHNQVPVHLALKDVLKVEERRPSSWTFQAHVSDTTRSTANFAPNVETFESQRELRTFIIKTLRQQAARIFSASNLKYI